MAITFTVFGSWFGIGIFDLIVRETVSLEISLIKHFECFGSWLGSNFYMYFMTSSQINKNVLVKLLELLGKNTCNIKISSF